MNKQKNCSFTIYTTEEESSGLPFGAYSAKHSRYVEASDPRYQLR